MRQAIMTKEHLAIAKVLIAAKWTQERTATALGISRNVLAQHMSNRPKSEPPSMFSEEIGQRVVEAFTAATTDARRAMATALRKLADEIETGQQAL